MAKSSKQRRLEIRAGRIRRARKLALAAEFHASPWLTEAADGAVEPNMVAADWNELAHNNTYGPLPRYYVDRAFECAACGEQELWTAKQQKWWYEIAKGDINTTAKYCHACRNLRRQARDEARMVHIRGLVGKHGLHEAARLLQKPPEEVERFMKE